MSALRVRVLAGTRRLADLTLKEIRKGLDRVHAAGASPQTLNAYRVALSDFYTWLVREGRWASNPLAAVAPLRPGAKTRERRALDKGDLGRLVAAAPPHRALVYLVAATTGLRRGELAALRWENLDLDGATVRVCAATAKNRKGAVLPLPAGTVAALRAIEPHDPTARLFAAVPTTPTFRIDLQAAGIEVETADGVVDFHALRATYATLLARSGVTLVQAQRLMRHSDPKLTANVYTRLASTDDHAAVAGIDLAPKRGRAKRA